MKNKTVFNLRFIFTLSFSNTFKNYLLCQQKHWRKSAEQKPGLSYAVRQAQV